MAKHKTTSLYALEYTPRFLRILSLDKTPQGYQVGHYEQRMLGLGMRSASLVQHLQEMRRALGAAHCTVTIGIQDIDLIMQCVRAPTQDAQDAYIQCQNHLRARLAHLKKYSWDAYPITNQPQAFCVAYPLDKIVWLQNLCEFCDLHVEIIEPCICALARASHILLQLPQAMFILPMAASYTLCLVVKDEIYAVHTFHEHQMLAQQINIWKDDPLLAPHLEKILHLFMVQELIDVEALRAHSPWPIQAINALDFIQTGARYSVQADGLQLLTCAGLALRQYV